MSIDRIGNVLKATIATNDNIKRKFHVNTIDEFEIIEENERMRCLSDEIGEDLDELMDYLNIETE